MELDDAYANAAHIPDSDLYPPRWAAQARAFRDRLSAEGRAELDISYGPTARQAFDLFMPETPPQGLLIFVHGGYWLRFDKSFWSHFAQGALDRGWAVAMPSYDLCPEVSIHEIVHQIAQMIPQAAKKVDGPIVLSGHSAGGHLVARMAVPGLLPPEVVVRLSRVLPISPVADLRPLLKTSMNQDFKLSIMDAAADSPTLMLPMPGVDVVVWVGGAERPVFLQQARGLGNAWRSDCVEVAGKHHFDIIDALSDESSALMVRLIDG